MKRCIWAMPEEVEKLNQIEICPKTMDLTCTLAKRIAKVPGGHELGLVRFMEVILDQAEVEDDTMIMNPEPSLKKNIGLYFPR
ncbi:hypothetical protein V6N12_045007 [Hibiscus sabdariffa]|uniref:Uncharacterized protein n=1 Tax=Hibiscus sabdariffa TaxID=183260 RepID=A0ABR2G2D0_9ROSI